MIALSSSNPFDIYFQLGIRKSFGEQPVIFLNNRLKYCGFWKPSSCVIWLIVLSVFTNQSLAISKRLNSIYSLNDFPVSYFSKSLKYSGDKWSRFAQYLCESISTVGTCFVSKWLFMILSNCLIIVLFASLRVMNWRS